MVSSLLALLSTLLILDREPYYPEFVNKWTTRRLADYMIDKIKNGVGNTGIRPGIIGEIGLDKAWIQGVEDMPDATLILRLDPSR